MTGVSPGSVTIRDAFANVDVYSGQVCNPSPSCPSANPSAGSSGPVIPTVRISCDITHLTVGQTNFPGTEQGTCTTSNVNPGGGTFNWSLNKSTTITLTPSENGSSADYQSKSNGASSSLGDTIITVNYTVNQEPASDSSQGITVHVPTSLYTNSTTVNDHTLSCPTDFNLGTLPCLAHPGDGTCNVKAGTSCSYSAPITRRWYSVLDQLSPANFFENVQLSGVTVTEQITPNQGSCGGNAAETGLGGWFSLPG
jgi:hypothetical protein